MISRWFLIVLAIVVLSSIVIVFVRIENRKEAERLEGGDLIADDFDIIE